MAVSKSKEINRIHTNKQGLNLHVDLSFGTNRSGFKNGYYVHVQSKQSSGIMSEYDPRQGVRLHVKEATRFNQKEFDRLADLNREPKHMIDMVLQDLGLELYKPEQTSQAV